MEKILYKEEFELDPFKAIKKVNFKNITVIILYPDGSLSGIQMDHYTTSKRKTIFSKMSYLFI